jgi:hypothetical protein
LTVEQVSRETRIPRKHLEAIEHDNLAALPGAFYQRAQIRTYARVVRLDPDLVLARLERGGAPSVIPGVPPRAHGPTRFRNRRALIASGFALTAIVLWRAVSRDMSLDGRMRVDRVADSAMPSASPFGEAATHAAVEIRQVESDQVPEPSAPTERALSAGIESTAARPTVAASVDLPAATTQSDERVAAPAATELIVATEPAGARVTVDGIGWGVTPVTIRYLPPGNKRIRVSKEGYATAEREVWVAEGDRKTTDIRLEDAP